MNWRIAGALAVAAAVAMGCSDGGTAASAPQTATLIGTISTASVSGTLTLDIPTALAPVRASAAPTAHMSGPVPVTGNCVVQGGPTVALNGTYDAATGALSVSGSGFTFSGTVLNGVLTGTFTTPGGETGGFSAADGASSTIVAFCGTYTETAVNGDHGLFTASVNFTAKTIVAVGVSQVDSSVTTMAGALSGSTFNITFPDGGGGTTTVTGSVTSTTLNGTFSDTNGGSGTVAGAPCS